MRRLLLLLVLTGAACSANARDDVRRFQLTGVVVGHEPSPPRIVVAHDAVDGLMPAMSMAFETAKDSPAVRDGDRILATLVLSGTASWLEDVRITVPSGAVGTRVPAAGRAMPGAVVPDLPLVDQVGAGVSLRDFAGRVVVVTFIYTRCPLPDFCPLMVAHLENVRRRANDDGLGDRLALVGVTLDPVYDTPAVLHAYGNSVLKASNRFDQWTLATGTPAQVEDVARFFDVGYRAEGGFVVHTLTTTVVGHDGRVIRIFASNSWRPEELYDVVRTGLERASVR
jgi:protein SCO1/2